MDAVSCPWTLPRPKNMPPACFYLAVLGRPFESRPSYQKRGRRLASSFLVREMGLEPTRRNHTHLKRACLPFQHSRKCHDIICAFPAFVKAFLPSAVIYFLLPFAFQPKTAWLETIEGRNLIKAILSINKTIHGKSFLYIAIAFCVFVWYNEKKQNKG